jgi:hypothetical protein
MGNKSKHKNFLIFTILVGMLGENLKSQINNAGFENWTTVTSGTLSYLEPNNWLTLNFLAPFGNPISTFRATGVDAHSGNFALKVVTASFSNKLGTPLPDSLGLCLNGFLNFSPPGLNTGSPYTARPTAFTFYAKYIPVGLDTGYAECTLYKRRPNNKRDTIGYVWKRILPSGVFVKHTLNINYFFPDSPDSVHIYFKSCNLDSNARRVGSAIYVDDIVLEGVVDVKEHSYYAANTKAFPNPAENVLNIEALYKDAEVVEIVNIEGQLLQTTTFCEGKVTINTQSFNRGCYFYRILNRDKITLTNGKFAVIK